MKYLYLKPMCSTCEKRKAELEKDTVPYILRDPARFENNFNLFDDADKEAFLQLQMQNLTFPVEVDIVD